MVAGPNFGNDNIMKKKTESPMVAVIFKAFAILSGVMALWQFGKGLTQMSGDAMSDGQSAGIALSLAVVYLGSGLMLWWMGEVVELLGRIAKNGEAAGNDGRREKPSRDQMERMLGGGKKVTSRDDDTAGPPRYEL